MGTDIVTGQLIKVWSGFIEIHITADVAYGVWKYYMCTGDPELGYEMFQKACLITWITPIPTPPMRASTRPAAAGCGSACVVQGFGGLRMLGGKLRISPNLPKAWNKLSYTLLWKGQKLAVTVSPGIVEIINQTESAPVALEVWGEGYTFEKELVVLNKAN